MKETANSRNLDHPIDELDEEVIESLNFKAREHLSRQMSILLLDGYYKDQIEIFAEYIKDAWGHEGWGDETFRRDLAELLDDSEIGETVKKYINNGEKYW